jgi:F-type H+-transporting ATPase subunit gamma
MAKARAIVKRRKAVQNICKITRTMQLIATARYQQAYNRAMRTHPYTAGISHMAEQLSQGAGDIEHPLLRENTESGRCVLLVLTSNRGLCGGYNSSLLREAVGQIKSLEHEGMQVDAHVFGKKGINYFKFLNRPIARQDTRFEDKPLFNQVEPIASELIEAYERKQLDAVYVTYMQFVSAATQRVNTVKLLPIQPPESEEELEEPPVETPQPVAYEFNPPEEQLLGELLPEVVKVRLFQCFIDAAVSEQVARMVAMKSATDAANDMIKTLTQQYNRARQTQITMELLDIVGGAEALQ